MPVEIKELVIRTVVAPTGQETPSHPQGGLVHGGPAGAPPVDTEALVQECVRQVMRMLAQQRER